jgi:hypothetical protein
MSGSVDQPKGPKSTKLRAIHGGERERVGKHFRALADDVERGDDAPPIGYAAVIVRSDGGVTMRWAGSELGIIGALEYAKATVAQVWRNEPNSYIPDDDEDR